MTSRFLPNARALRSRNFRLLWLSLFVSFAGSFMQQAAILWHVSLLVPPDRKGLALGIVGLVKVAPIVVLSMVSGVVADAWNRLNGFDQPMPRINIVDRDRSSIL